MARLLSLLTLIVLPATTALAQVVYQPTPSPTTFASDRDWYRSGAPLPFGGDVYYPTGPTVYFNGNTMVPTGQYDGITLYADTTVEPYSVVFVPVTDDILRPYRPRTVGDQARYTLGGNPPSFGSAQESYGGRPVEPPQQYAPPEPQPQPQPYYPFEPPREFRLETALKPTANSGIWLAFQGRRWESAGAAVPLDPVKMATAGEYAGFPVYADAHEPYVIYLPTLGDLVAPFRRTP